MKKLISWILTIALLCLLVPAQVYAASQGDLRFELNRDGESYYVKGCFTFATGEVIIPDTYNDKPVTGIGRAAFKGCTRLTSIKIPDSVVIIEPEAFYECTGLTSVIIGSGVTSIGARAFYECTGLTSLVLPDGVTTIQDQAFNICTGLTSINIPNSVTSIGSNVFDACHSLEYNIYDNAKYLGNATNPYVVLVDTVSTDIATCDIHENTKLIGVTAFSGNANLTSITIPDRVISVGKFAFSRCTGLTQIIIPDSVTTIGQYAFSNCKNLSRVIGGEGLTSIQTGAFEYCTSLTSFEIPGSVPTVSSNLFQGCSNLSDVIIGNGVTIINDYAFSGCTALTSITIPDSITEIANQVFNACTGLTEIHFKGNAPRIKYQAFYNVTATAYYPGTDATWTEAVLKDYGGTITWVPVIEGSEGLRYTLSEDGTYYTVSSVGSCTDTEITIPDTHQRKPVKEIGNDAFSGYSRMTKIVIPDSVTTIGSSAFKGCFGLVSVIIPESVSAIGDEVFGNCTGLTEIYFNGDAPSLGNQLFSGVTAAAYYLGRNETWTEAVRQNYGGTITWIALEQGSDGLAYELSADDSYYIVSGIGSCVDTEITIPSIYRGKPVKEIDGEAFLGCTALTDVTIPDSITTIGIQAFSSCTGLTSIDIPDSVTHIYDSAFSNCNGLTSVNIGSGVTSISNCAFMDCTGLTSITIPDAVTTIGDSVFMGCTSLTDATIGNGVTSVGHGMFWGCGNLSNITIGNSLTAISMVMFSRCASLTSIVIPAQITAIEGQAFNDCTGLTEIQFKGNAPAFSSDAFRNVIATAHYPAGNATWTEDVRQNYGGNITWVAVGEAEHTVTWISASTTLGGNIGLNFYVELSDSLVNDESTFMRFTFAGNTVDVPLADAVFTDGQYKFTCPVNAKNMTDVVTAQVMTSGGAVGDAKSLAVVTYCNFMIQYGNDPELVHLMKAMLNYGAAAQVLFNHNTENLANAGLSEADKVLADVDASGYAASVSGSEEGIALASASLMLETETSIRIYFKLTGSKTVDAFTFLVDGKEVKPVQKGSEYYVEIANIAAQDLDAMHTVTVGGLTVRYGGLSYVNTVLNNQAIAGEALVNTAKALFAYNKLAESYFN